MPVVGYVARPQAVLRLMSFERAFVGQPLEQFVVRVRIDVVEVLEVMNRRLNGHLQPTRDERGAWESLRRVCSSGNGALDRGARH